jgi:glycopeptide antibiotics resistance protein
MNRRWALAVLALVVAALAAGTLGPSPADLIVWVSRGAEDRGLDSVTYGAVERGANLLMFVPVGFLLAAALPRLSGWWVWVVCAAASASVELIQTAIPQRQTSGADVLLNVVGAGAGILFHAAVRHRRRRPPPE